MAKKLNPVEEAVKKAGGARRVSVICDVAQQTVYNWIAAGRMKGVREAAVLADAAKIDVRDLA